MKKAKRELVHCSWVDSLLRHHAQDVNHCPITPNHLLSTLTQPLLLLLSLPSLSSTTDSACPTLPHLHQLLLPTYSRTMALPPNTSCSRGPNPFPPYSGPP